MGHHLLLAAFVFSLISIAGLFLGGITRNKWVLTCAGAGVFIALGLVTAATAYMIRLLLIHDFSFEFVAEYTSRGMPRLYLISALWAGNLGTLMLWTWLMAAVGALVVITSRARDREIAPYATAVVMITVAFLLALTVYVKNPFAQMSIVPDEGLGMNPLLKNIVMLLHPPVIMAGYAGFTVPFALAVAALLTGKLDNDWLVSARRWTLISWLLLGAGIIMGAWFSYTGLGAGSYWHWEPVENVSLIPWLSATAILHSMTIQRKRGACKVWSMMLIILTFGVVIFSTFLSRSDVIASGNTFSNSTFGPQFLVFLSAAMLLPLILVFLRRRRLEGKLQIESLASKESTFLITNLLLIVSAITILAGTIFVLLNTRARALPATQAVRFFNQVNVPIFVAVVLLAGICTTIRWGQTSKRSLGRKLLWPFIASVVLGVVLFLFGIRSLPAIVSFAACCFVPFAVANEWVKSTRARHRSRGENYFKAFPGLIWSDKPRHGGHIVHIALIMIAVGIIGSSAFGVSKEASLLPGQSTTIGGYTLVYNKLNYDPLPGRLTFTADVSVYKNGKFVAVLKPVSYFDASFNGEVETAAIRSTPADDLYITIAGWDATGLTAFKTSIYPLTMWIWIGGWVMLLGGLIAFWPERKRSESAAAEEDKPVL
jgi:cytochrome c-type biogenesis protein CcmF